MAARYSTGYRKLVVIDPRHVRLYWYAQYRSARTEGGSYRPVAAVNPARSSPRPLSTDPLMRSAPRDRVRTGPSVDQAAARQVQEDVFEAGAAHQGAVGDEPEVVHLFHHLLAVVGVEEQAVREDLEALCQSVHALGDLVVVA